MDNRIRFSAKDHISPVEGDQLTAVLNTINMVSDRGNLQIRKKVPVAITLSKSDVYKNAMVDKEKLFAEEENSILFDDINYPLSDSKYQFDPDAQEAVAEAVSRVLESAALSAAVARFKTKAYFAFSALGKPLSKINPVVKDSEAEDEMPKKKSARRAHAEPVRIEEGLAWIMAKWGWIDIAGDGFGSFVRRFLDNIRR